MLNIEGATSKREGSIWTPTIEDYGRIKSLDDGVKTWRQIPLDYLKGYEVSVGGEIRYVDPKTKIVESVTPYINNGYAILNLKHATAYRSNKFKLHRLVAVTFLPIPNEGEFKKLEKVPDDGVPYQVNHVNSVRYDNNVSNLEWCDDQHNFKHSLDNNRHSYSLNMTILDTKTNKTHDFTHMREVSDFFKSGPEALVHRLALATKIPYLNRYKVLSVNTEGLKNDGSVTYSSIDNVLVYDAIRKRVSVYVSRRAAAVETGIAMRTIRDVVERYRKDATDTKIGGYMFRPVSVDKKWPAYSQMQALNDNRSYVQQTMKGISNSSISIEVLDYVTGEKSSFDSVKEAADHYGYSSVTLNKYVRIPNAKTKELRLYDGKVFKSSDNLGNWPDYSKEQAIASKAATARNNAYGVRKEFLVVNETSGESVTKPNLRAVADYLAINRSTMSSWFNNNPDRSFNGHKVSVK